MNDYSNYMDLYFTIYKITKNHKLIFLKDKNYNLFIQTLIKKMIGAPVKLLYEAKHHVVTV